ncbi:hypothetical protein BD410DRAFT_459223 [Rickenella mellea]|uniref:F-box domain-containing protein n=1 Tax=Rickenella mellea TaxID=50990 RepID=A0A4Y7PVL5_9AGAM|nr:hypothetical protein BD410DRAFT_459223 [Rickenella mellea]
MSPITRSTAARSALAVGDDLENAPTTTCKRGMDTVPDISAMPTVTLNALSSLPEDILRMIFKCLQDVLEEIQWATPPVFPPPRTKTARKSWISVTHVCRRWREVALNSPLLWSNNGASCLEQIEAYLARSRTTPIATQINGNDGTAVEELVLQQLPRTKSLAVMCLDDHLEKDESLRPLWDLPTPFLEALMFTRLFGSGHPPAIFGRPHPLLKTVMLFGVHTPWDSPAFTDLKCLALVGIMEKHQPTMSELFQILLTCPNLESLTLKKAGPKESHDLQESPVIHLPRLLKLDVEMNTHDWSILLQNLSFPETTTWNIACRELVWTNPLIVIPRQISLTVGASKLTIAAADSGMAIIGQEDITSDNKLDRQIHIQLHDDTHDVGYIFHLVPIAIHGTSLVDITCLYMQFILYDDWGVAQNWTEDWLYFLETLPRLEDMTISLVECSIMDPGIEFFSALSTERKEEDTISYPAPNLRKLELHGYRKAYQSLLIQCLTTRFKLAPLSDLVLRNCGQATKKNLKALRQLVGKLQVMTAPFTPRFAGESMFASSW